MENEIKDNVETTENEVSVEETVNDKAETVAEETPSKEEVKAETAEENKTAEETKTEEVKEEKPAETNSDEKEKKPEKKKNTGKKVGAAVGIIAVIIAIVLVVIIAVVILIVVLLNKRTTVDVSKYFVYEESGYDGYGEVYAEFDVDAFVQDFSKIRYNEKEVRILFDDVMEDMAGAYMSASDINESYVELMEEVENEENGKAFLFTVFAEIGELDKTEDLANGDTVTFDYYFTKEQLEKAFKVNIEGYDETNHVMNELKAIEKYDAFDGIEVTYTGFGPNGTASLNVYGKEGLSYSLDKSEGLSNGDVVTINVEYSASEESYINNFGRVPQEMSKSVTVEGLSEYLASAANLSPELIESMNNQAYDKIRAHAANSNPTKAVKEVESITYIGNYFLKNKDTTSTYDNNSIYMVYKIRYKYTIKDHKNKENVRYVEAYNYVNFDNIIVEPDGKQSVDLNSGKMETWDAFMWETDVINFKGFGMTTYAEYAITGFNSIESLYAETVTKNLDDFNHEDSVADVELGEPTM